MLTGKEDSKDEATYIFVTIFVSVIMFMAVARTKKKSSEIQRQFSNPVHKNYHLNASVTETIQIR